MTLLLELNDLGIRCYSGGRLLHESPGVALVDRDQLLFGDEALHNSRNQPLHTHTRFWSQLNLDAISSGDSRVRHHADLAYLHLQHIESRCELDFAGQQTVLALSGQSDKQALGLLLGITRQCGLQVTGMMDTALACLLPQVRKTRSMHLEIHLHHTIVSHLELRNGRLQLHNLELIPALGWLDLQQHLLRYLSNQFIRQTRFNPRHDARSEQQLFDALPDLLHRAERERAIECQLSGHSLQLDASQLCDEVVRWLQPAQEKLQHDTDNCDLFIGDRMSRLGMFLSSDLQARHLSPAQVHNALSAVGEQLPRQTDGLRFTRSLDCLQEVESNPPVSATHILHGSRAYPLAGDWSLNPLAENPLEAGENPGAIALLRNGRIVPVGGTVDGDALQLNGISLSGERNLHRGDRISIGRHGPTLELITVEG